MDVTSRNLQPYTFYHFSNYLSFMICVKYNFTLIDSLQVYDDIVLSWTKILQDPEKIIFLSKLYQTSPTVRDRRLPPEKVFSKITCNCETLNTESNLLQFIVIFLGLITAGSCCPLKYWPDKPT